MMPTGCEWTFSYELLFRRRVVMAMVVRLSSRIREVVRTR